MLLQVGDYGQLGALGFGFVFLDKQITFFGHASSGNGISRVRSIGCCHCPRYAAPCYSRAGKGRLIALSETGRRVDLELRRKNWIFASGLSVDADPARLRCGGTQPPKATQSAATAILRM
ncbi:hypothetical protein ABIF63_000406 [Bradyrhizobium japonicum]|uniref:Uncharacterized protein n=1 Tax=Bradyrhizobium japonicum TaxID=375 RepID=A0ABV2RH87_BRAJP